MSSLAIAQRNMSSNAQLLRSQLELNSQLETLIKKQKRQLEQNTAGLRRPSPLANDPGTSGNSLYSLMTIEECSSAKVASQLSAAAENLTSEVL